MAWDDDEAKGGVFFEEAAVDAEADGFFAWPGGSGDPEGLAGHEAEGVADGLAGLGGGVGVEGVVFDVACDQDSLAGNSGPLETVGVDGVLHAEKVERVRAKGGGEEGTGQAVAGNLFFPHAAIDDEDGHAALMGDAEKVGPEFELDQHDEVRLNTAEGAADNGGEIEWVIEAALGAEKFLREVLAGVGGGGDADVAAGIFADEKLDERESGVDFADGDGVDPDAGAGGVAWGDGAEALAEPGAPARGGGKFEQDEGRGNDGEQEVGDIKKE